MRRRSLERGLKGENQCQFITEGWASLPGLIQRAGADENVRCVLIRAEGRGFCGGVDIKEMQAHPERIVQLNKDNYLTFKAIRDCAVPVVGALHGFVIGGGVNIAGACDALIAARMDAMPWRMRSSFVA